MTNIRFYLLFLLAICTIKLAPVYAQGILFSEYRLLLDSKEIKTLQVCNPTDDEQSYMLSLANKKMDENGVFSEIPDTISPAFSLKKNIRIFPKTIKLNPGECQEVQIQIRSIDKLSPGEYRSYLQFIPQIANNEDQEENPAEGGMQMSIVFRVTPAIPILFRKESELKSILISDVNLTKKNEKTYYLKFLLKKEGNQSTYGAINVEQIVGGEVIPIVELKGQAVYGEANKRYMRIAIEKDELRILNDNKISLKISYVDGENTTKKIILADKLIDISIPD